MKQNQNPLSHEEAEIREDAIRYAQKHKKRIAREITSKVTFQSDDSPVSVFMAGSPGAGKTESARELLKTFDSEENRVLHIDADEYRKYLPDYNGDNSHLFQAAASIILEKVHDLALSNNLSFILDGTLSSFEKASENIKRSIKRNRYVQILYVYQSPSQAWRFVMDRELTEGRRILPEVFLEQFFASRETTNSLKYKFGKDIHIDLLIKNLDGSNREYRANVDRIDNHIREKYDFDMVAKIVGLK